MKFSEGAGSATVIADRIQEIIPLQEFEKEKEVAPGLVLRSPEELYYYRIWSEAMEPHISPHLVGRTLDRTAAAKV